MFYNEPGFTDGTEDLLPEDMLEPEEQRDLSLTAVLGIAAFLLCFLLALFVTQSAEFAADYETCLAAGGDTLTCANETGGQ